MGRKLSARASCIPCLNGEKFVMRLLDPNAMRVDLTKLGMPDDVLQKWQRAIQVPYGLILVTGSLYLIGELKKLLADTARI